MADFSDRQVMTAIRSEPNSPENRLLDELGVIEKTPNDMSALHIHFSRLRKANQKHTYIRIAEKCLEPVIATYGALLYQLGNNDMFLVSKNVQVHELDDALARVKDLFVADPLMSERDAGGNEAWVTWYDLETDIEDFREAAVRTVIQSKRENLESRIPTLGQTPVDPTNLEKVARAFTKQDVLPLMKKQSCVRVHTDGSTADVLFQEVTVSIAELAQRTAPDVNLYANPWLFRHLTLVLDHGLLRALRGQNFRRLEGVLSANLNLQTIEGMEFSQFDEHVGDNTDKVIIELQPMDILSDMESYIHTREWLQSKGYRILIDGLDPLSLEYFDPALFDADFYKIAAAQKIGQGFDKQGLRDLNAIIQDLGPEKVILARVDSEDSIRFGLQLGISCFQGFFIDDVFLEMQNRQNSRTGRA